MKPMPGEICNLTGRVCTFKESDITDCEDCPDLLINEGQGFFIFNNIWVSGSQEVLKELKNTLHGRSTENEIRDATSGF